jgi:hypothetical protein
MLVFAGAMAINLVQGRDIECGCFGDRSPQRISWLSVGRNILLANVAFATAVANTAEVAPGETLAAAGSAILILTGWSLVSTSIRARPLIGLSRSDL